MATAALGAASPSGAQRWVTSSMPPAPRKVESPALRSTRDPGAPEELAQDVFVRAYRALATYDAERIGELRLRAWLARITLNLCRNRARARRVAPPEGPIQDLPGPT